MTGRAHTQKWF